MNKQLINIKDRIEERSKDSRSNYLEKIKFSSEQSKSARDNMGCSNIAPVSYTHLTLPTNREV